ncbi:hypothetical protein BDP67DRAFT_563883 [Colletotrichum lupini]|nr:hypothetical protein BDP67DRAFT_563883 [Colletotrichum lupini]
MSPPLGSLGRVKPRSLSFLCRTRAPPYLWACSSAPVLHFVEYYGQPLEPDAHECSWATGGVAVSASVEMHQTIENLTTGSALEFGAFQGKLLRILPARGHHPESRLGLRVSSALQGGVWHFVDEDDQLQVRLLSEMARNQVLDSEGIRVDAIVSAPYACAFWCAVPFTLVDDIWVEGCQVVTRDTAVSWELGREGFPLASNCARSRVLPGPGLGFRESWTGVEAPPEPFSIRRFGDDVKIAGFHCPEKQGAESWTGKCRATTSGRGSVFHTHRSALGGPRGLG